MRIAIPAFAAGVAWLQWQAALPESALLWQATAVALALAVGGVSVRPLRLLLPVGAFLCGIAWAGFAAQARLADALAPALEGSDVEVVGVVAGLPQRFENGERFDFEVERAPAGVPRRLSLAWYRAWDEGSEARTAPPSVHAGERWRLTLRLKRPHGNLNPGGFDYEAWLLERNLRATGYVRPAATNGRLDAMVWRPSLAVAALREASRERFRRVLGEGPGTGILVALAVGDQRAIEPWCVTKETCAGRVV